VKTTKRLKRSLLEWNLSILLIMCGPTAPFIALDLPTILEANLIVGSMELCFYKFGKAAMGSICQMWSVCRNRNLSGTSKGESYVYWLNQFCNIQAVQKTTNLNLTAKEKALVSTSNIFPNKTRSRKKINSNN
jgi:hypothetical protein